MMEGKAMQRDRYDPLKAVSSSKVVGVLRSTDETNVSPNVPLPAVALIFKAVVDSCESIPESFAFEIRMMVQSAIAAGWPYDGIAATLIGCCQAEAEAFGKVSELVPALEQHNRSLCHLMHSARELQCLRARHRYVIALMVTEEALEQLLEQTRSRGAVERDQTEDMGSQAQEKALRKPG